MSRDKLQNAVDAKTTPVYLANKADIVEAYKDTYGKAWKQKIVHDLAAITGIKPKNLERRFDPSRLASTPRSAKAKGEYEKLGQALPPTGKALKGDSITVTVRGSQNAGFRKNAQGVRKSIGTRERSWTVTLTGPSAQNFINNPTYEAFFDELGYPQDVIELFGDGDYALVVYSVA